MERRDNQGEDRNAPHFRLALGVQSYMTGKVDAKGGDHFVSRL